MAELYWRKAIREARVRGHFTGEDNDKAVDWPDCACGEQDPRISRYSEDVYERNADGVPTHLIHRVGEPRDSKLFELGIDFCDMVQADEIDEAESLLNQIEARAAELLAGVGP